MEMLLFWGKPIYILMTSLWSFIIFAHCTYSIILGDLPFQWSDLVQGSERNHQQAEKDFFKTVYPFLAIENCTECRNVGICTLLE